MEPSSLQHQNRVRRFRNRIGELRESLGFSEVQERLGAEAGPSEDWYRRRNPDGSTGAWVRKDAQVDPGAFLGPDAIVYGKGTEIGAETAILGRSTVGPDIKTSGKTRIEDSYLVGGSLFTGPIFSRAFWTGQKEIVQSEVVRAHLNDSSLDQAVVRDASIKNSILSESQAIGCPASVSARGEAIPAVLTRIFGSTLQRNCEVLAGAFIEDSVLESHTRVIGNRIFLSQVQAAGATIDKPGNYTNEKIGDDRYSIRDSIRKVSIIEQHNGRWVTSSRPPKFPDPELSEVMVTERRPVPLPGHITSIPFTQVVGRPMVRSREAASFPQPLPVPTRKPGLSR